LLAELSQAPFHSDLIQNFLPGALQTRNTDAILQSGIQGIGNLIQNPGRLSPTVADSIRQRLASESEAIGTNFRGIRSQQAGATARSNAPLSIKTALGSALDVAQERAQRGARRDALSASEDLRREDLGQTFNLLDIINQFIGTRLAPSISGAGIGAQQQGQQNAALLGAAGEAFAAFSGSRFKEGFEDISEDEILSAVRSLPLYRWSYKGEETQHIGPIAEDFLETFRVGDDPDKIPIVDAIGTLLAATQSLATKVERLESGA